MPPGRGHATVFKQRGTIHGDLEDGVTTSFDDIGFFVFNTREDALKFAESLLMMSEYTRDEFTISLDKARLDLNAIHDFLSKESYWAQNRPIEHTKTAIEHSICFGVYDGKRQIGFARVVSDCATFAYIGDVYILDEYRGQGLSKWLMEVIVSHSDLQNLRRWVLATRDAHGLYEKYDFAALRFPDRWMERTARDAY